MVIQWADWIPGKQHTALCWGLHEDIGACVWQSESDQTAANQHRRRQQDGDGLGDANQRAKDQVAQHRRQLTHGVTEAKARAPKNKRTESDMFVLYVSEDVVNCSCTSQKIKDLRLGS